MLCVMEVRRTSLDFHQLKTVPPEKDRYMCLDIYAKIPFTHIKTKPLPLPFPDARTLILPYNDRRLGA